MVVSPVRVSVVLALHLCYGVFENIFFCIHSTAFIGSDPSLAFALHPPPPPPTHIHTKMSSWVHDYTAQSDLGYLATSYLDLFLSSHKSVMFVVSSSGANPGFSNRGGIKDYVHAAHGAQCPLKGPGSSTVLDMILWYLSLILKHCDIKLDKKKT